MRRCPQSMIVLLATFLAPVDLVLGAAYVGTRLLRSGPLEVVVDDPADPNGRWNRGLRFSPVANIVQVRLGARTFCYAPLDGGRLSYLGGLPMEFDIGQASYQPDPPGYDSGRNGDPFLKIGVGILRRNAAAYDFSSRYPVIELARTTATWAADRVHFEQSLAGTANGYAYRLEEDVIVKNDRLILHTVLSNTGTRPFVTEQYLHNFLSFLGRPVGPNYRVMFPHPIATSPEVPAWIPPTLKPGGRAPVVVNDNPALTRLADTLVYTAAAAGVPKVWVTHAGDGSGPTSFAVEQSDTDQRVVIDSTWPATYVGVWTTDYQVAPEQFLTFHLAPGEEADYRRSYRFSADGSLATDAVTDGRVDARDLERLARAWLAAPGSRRWDAAADLDAAADEAVDLRDLARLGATWRNVTRGATPAAAWSLDDGSGRVAADRSGDHPGTLLGFPADGGAWVSGRIGGALACDGVDDRVLVSGYAGVTGRAPRTVTAWIRTLGGLGTPRALVAWGDPAPGAAWVLGVGPAGHLRLSNGLGTMALGERPLDDDWHHVAAVLDPVQDAAPRLSDAHLYLDGTRELLYDLVTGPVDTGSTRELRIGAGIGSPWANFEGRIDEVAVYRQALGASAIRALAHP